ncbi:MAG: hypothetical protein M3Y40_00665 [Chloroflexota bacterium]|nr:hypothetical protein [Chloroflexota bacterium]
MSRKFRSRFALAAGTAVLLTTLSVGSVLGGEVTGTRESLKIENSKWGTGLHARSFCAFSGQNDNPTSTDPMNPPGRVQSYGYSVVKEGAKAFAPTPAEGCNPNAGFEE